MSAFCSQDCFKAAWKKHKQLHKCKILLLHFVSLSLVLKFEFYKPKTVAIQQRKAESASEQHQQQLFAGFEFSGPLRPGNVSAQMQVASPASASTASTTATAADEAMPTAIPASIELPEYALTGEPVREDAVRREHKIDVVTPANADKMRRSGRLAGELLQMCGAMVQVGVTPEQLDRAVFAAAVAHNAYPSPLNYRGFPKSLCVSVNEVICHGIPDDRPFEDGDIVNCDVTIFREGHHGDW